MVDHHSLRLQTPVILKFLENELFGNLPERVVDCCWNSRGAVAEQADDLFGGPQGSLQTDPMNAPEVQWAERIMQKIDGTYSKQLLGDLLPKEQNISESPVRFFSLKRRKHSFELAVQTTLVR